MPSKDKRFERIMRLVQESLKGANDLRVHQNYLIPNVDGRNREIDILIEATVNGFAIRIAIECKHYAKRIPPKEVEAFHSKCLRLPGINKKVFISSSGYQADALLAAKTFDIEALTAQALSTEIVQAWMPVNNLQLVIHERCENITWFLDCDNLERIKTYQTQSKGVAKIEKKHEVKLDELLSKAVNSAKDYIWRLSVVELLKVNMTNLGPFLIPIQLEPTDWFIETETDGFVKILGVKFKLRVFFRTTPAEIIDARDLTDTAGNWRATTLSVAHKGGIQTDIVHTGADAPSFFQSNEKGEFVKLKTLFKYDPKTGEFTQDG